MENDEMFFMRHPWQFDPQAERGTPPDHDLGFNTRALHSGFDPRKNVQDFRSFTVPIIQSMTYPYSRFRDIPNPVYGRTSTPTTRVLEQRLAALEGGESCVSAGSGSQALFNLIFTLARPGDKVVTSLNIYGEGYKQAQTIFPERCNVEFGFVDDPSDLSSWEKAVDDRTKLVWVETPSNPCLFVTDIQGIAEIAHARGVPLLVDNTTATAALQQPLELGADIVLLSITKFISGNASVLGGAVIGPEALVEDIRWNTTEFVGSVLQPFEAWLTLQFLETLSLRMEKHSRNALQIAEYLMDHPRVEHVNYPGLPSHPQFDLASNQMQSGGGMLSFVVPDGIPGAARVIDSFQRITHAVTFGTSRTICMHPPTITHEHMTSEERQKAGIADGLIRLSVGLEDVEDVIFDLDRALSG
jgi:cystathionine beta-lyase/cystathionine gamma-synthase